MHLRGVPRTDAQAPVSDDGASPVPALHVSTSAASTRPQGTSGPDIQTWYGRGGELVAYGGCDEHGGWMTWPHLATYRFSPDQPHVIAHPEPQAPPEAVWDTFRRSVLPIAMQARGWEAMHASAVLCARGVVAFCAVSGTGKSSVAYGLVRRGFPQWADDAVVVAAAPPPSSIPLPFEVRLRDSARALFDGPLPVPRRFVRNGPGDQHHRRAAEIASICVLSRGAGVLAPRITEVEPAAAFRALLTHAHELSPGNAKRRAALLEAYLTIVATVPVYTVEFDPDRNDIKTLLDVIVDGLALEPPRTGMVRVS